MYIHQFKYTGTNKSLWFSISWRIIHSRCLSVWKWMMPHSRCRMESIQFYTRGVCLSEHFTHSMCLSVWKWMMPHSRCRMESIRFYTQGVCSSEQFKASDCLKVNIFYIYGVWQFESEWCHTQNVRWKVYNPTLKIFVWKWTISCSMCLIVWKWSCIARKQTH